MEDLPFLCTSMRFMCMDMPFLSYFGNDPQLRIVIMKNIRFLMQFLTYFGNDPQPETVIVKSRRCLYSIIQFLSYFDNDPQLRIVMVEDLPLLCPSMGFSSDFGNDPQIIKSKRYLYSSMQSMFLYMPFLSYFGNDPQLRIVVVEGMPVLNSNIPSNLKVLAHVVGNELHLKIVIVEGVQANFKVFPHVVHYHDNYLQLKIVVVEGMRFLYMYVLSHLSKTFRTFTRLKILVVEGMPLLYSCMLSNIVHCCDNNLLLKLVILKGVRFLYSPLQLLYLCALKTFTHAISCYYWLTLGMYLRVVHYLDKKIPLKIVVGKGTRLLYSCILSSLKVFASVIGKTISCYYSLTFGVFFSVVHYLVSIFMRCFNCLFGFGKGLFVRMCFTIKHWLLGNVFYFVNIFKTTNIFGFMKSMWSSFKK